MEIKDIKVGMKVKLLGKHGGFVDNYDNIEDWYKDCNYWEEVQQIKEQGFGIITNIKEYGDIWVSSTINGNRWCFLFSDLEPAEEELLLPIGTKIRQVKPRFCMANVLEGLFEVVEADNTHVFTKYEQDTWVYCSINKQELEECWEVVEEKKDKWEDRWHSHGLVQYKVHSNGKKVKVKIASGDVGVAICADSDKFDLKKGIEIARTRATIKKLEKQIKKLSK